MTPSSRTRSAEGSYPRIGAALYDALLAPAALRAAEPVLDEVASTAPHGGRVLDVGCGGGQVLVALAQRRPDLVLTGLDPSGRLVGAARHRAGGARVVRGSATDLPFTDAAFDVVLALFSLKEWPDRDRGVREAARVLAPGGRLLVAELHAAAPRGQWQAFIDLGRLPHPLASAFVTATLHPVVRRGVSTAELQRLLAVPGLEGAQVEADGELAVARARAQRSALSPKR